MLEPLGESQGVAYIERLTDRADITLLSFEKPADLADAGRLSAMRARLAGAGITWMVRRYHKHPAVVSTAWDVVVGCVAARRWAARSSGDSNGPPLVVHARGYVPALIALYVQRARGARFLFDMRGFWVDEKVEAGHWMRGGAVYRAGKWCERRFLSRADAIVSLTEAGVRELPSLGGVRAGVAVRVIPTCTDLLRFTPECPCGAGAALRRDLGLEGSRVVGYVGTLSNWYLRDESLAYMALLLRKVDGMKALIVTRDDHEPLRADALRHGLPADRLVLTRVPLERMPELIRLMDVGVFFIRIGFSKRASAATRLGEFLGCGVPVVINDGVGDSGGMVRDTGTGVVLPDTSEAAIAASVAPVLRLLDDDATAGRCRAAAMARFDLAAGANQYGHLYEQLAATVPSRRECSTGRRS